MDCFARAFDISNLLNNFLNCLLLLKGFDNREFKQLVRLRLRGWHKTKGLIKEDNSLHVNMHQTDQLAIVEFEIATWKSLILGFLEYVNIDTQNCPVIFLFYNQGL